MSKVASLSPAAADRLARLSGTPWFSNSLRVDVVRVGGREGAYTSMDPAPGHITISSSNAYIQDWMAGEIMFHEASHLLFLPIMDAFTAEMRAQGKDVRRGPIESWNVNLWHVALFYMTGEVVRQALASRGIGYEPYLYKTGLFDRAWAHFRGADRDILERIRQRQNVAGRCDQTDRGCDQMNVSNRNEAEVEYAA